MSPAYVPLVFFLLLLLPVPFFQSARVRVRVRSTRTQIARWWGHFLGGHYHYTTIFWPSILIQSPYQISLLNFLI